MLKAYKPTRKDITIYEINAMDKAAEMKNSKVFNMIVLGGLLKVVPVVSTKGEEDLRGAEQERRVGVGVLRALADESVDGERERAGVADGRVDEVHHEPAAERRDVAEHTVRELARVHPAREDAERVDAGERAVVEGRAGPAFWRSEVRHSNAAGV